MKTFSVKRAENSWFDNSSFKWQQVWRHLMVAVHPDNIGRLSAEKLKHYRDMFARELARKTEYKLADPEA